MWYRRGTGTLVPHVVQKGHRDPIVSHVVQKGHRRQYPTCGTEVSHVRGTFGAQGPYSPTLKGHRDPSPTLKGHRDPSPMVICDTVHKIKLE